ncbi:MAG: phosphonate C-P lyase system protein PhnH [Comamonadaceae bacterium]|nr:MAG: phosphonate C-P lyase system protein PhnH [Comamonadaceae bacterium]
MNTTTSLAPGLLDEVHETQSAFRALLDALARPGEVRTLAPALPGVALGGAMARLLLTLCDEETPVWWQNSDPDLQHWLRFHTGATVAPHPAMASFAALTDVGSAPALADFAAGSAASPEFSSTLVIELPSLQGGTDMQWRGPGIEEQRRVALQGLSADFWRQWQVNHATFPQGVDIIFTCAEQIVGLPRTTRAVPLEEA